MTRPTPHLAVGELADVLAGERPDDAHLAGCASCRDRLAELEAALTQVAADLAALPEPPLPDGLQARLSAALAAEPPLPSAGAPPAPQAQRDEEPVTRSSTTVVPATVTPLASRRRSWLPAAAAAVLLLGGGGLGLALLTGDGDGSSTTAGDAAAPVLPRSASGTDYADSDAVVAALPGVLAGTAPGGTARSTAEDAEVATGGTTSAAPGAAAPPTATPLTTTSVGDPLARLRDPAGLAGCLAALLPPEEPDLRPLALDYASYAGTPALAVVLPDPDPSRVQVFVVGAGCSQADDSTLQFVRVDRPS